MEHVSAEQGQVVLGAGHGVLTNDANGAIFLLRDSSRLLLRNLGRLLLRNWSSHNHLLAD